MKTISIALTLATILAAHQTAAAQKPGRQVSQPQTIQPPKPEPPKVLNSGGPGWYLLSNTYIYKWNESGNFTPTKLPKAALITDIYVGDADLYASGYVYGEHSTNAAYWKNGELNILEPTVVTRATAIYVSDGNVYVAGLYGGGKQERPVLWTNGERQDLDKPGRTRALIPKGIWAKGEDVIVVGQESGDGDTPTHTFFVWKNGEMTDPLPNRSTDDYRLDIKVIDGDIYIGGSKEVHVDGYYNLVAWKNGKPVKLPTTKFFSFRPPIVPFFVSDGDLYFYRSIRRKMEDTYPDIIVTKNEAVLEHDYETDTNPYTLEKIPIRIDWVFAKGDDIYAIGESDYENGSKRKLTVWKNGKRISQTQNKAPGGRLVVKE